MKRYVSKWVCIPMLLMVLVACATRIPRATASRIETGTIASQALANNLLGDPATRTYNIYLPPGYDTGNKRYPVVYLLHGYTQTNDSYVEPVSRSEDSLIAQGTARGLIIVFVDGSNQLGGSWYTSSPTIGDYETYITKELVALIDGKYRTLPSRNSRGITGCSMGGYGTAHLAFTYPDVFSVAAPISGIYSWDPEIWDSIASLFKFEPKSRYDWVRLDPGVQLRIASAAGAASNPDKPPFYLDMPFKLVDGKGQNVPEVDQKIAALDPTHDAQRYLNQRIRLKGLMIYHGDADSSVPVEHARAFDKTLTRMGIDHEYVEVQGGEHCTLDWGPILGFMSDHLTF